MGVGQLSESDAVDALRLPFYSSSHPTGSHGWRNQFDLGNPDFYGVAPIIVSLVGWRYRPCGLGTHANQGLLATARSANCGST